MTSDFDENTESEDTQSFAELFESYTGDHKDLRVGDRISGKIIAVGADAVFIDAGSKIDGVVEKAELLEKDGEFPYKVGDVIDLYVIAADDAEIRLSRSISGIGSAHLLQEAYESKIPVEGKVLEQIKGGFKVDIMKVPAFCPVSQMDLRYVDTPEDYVGQTFNFLISRFEKGGKNLVVSRRDLLQREQAAAREEFLKTLEIGAIIEGKVVKTMPFGVFVELEGGVEGMVHISELNWSRTVSVDQAVEKDQIIKVKVIGMDARDKTPGKTRIALSMKQVGGDPWDDVASKFSAGDKVSGTVTRCADFGAFVEIAPGIEGLVHISEMSYAKRVLRAEDVVSPGDAVVVTVKTIDPLARRISLSLKDAEGDPWNDIDKKYNVGKPANGILEKKEPFGMFITLEPGVTGLLPKSKLEAAPDPAAIDRLKPGDALVVVIQEIHPRERKITLGLPESGDQKAWQDYSAERVPATAVGSMGDLGDKLRAALKSKTPDKDG
jgi:small subunit ribosomal protein S1